MTTVAQQISKGILLVGLVAGRIDAIRQRRHGSCPRGAVEVAWGRSESLDPDNVGDIADEGAGHRG
jgi:hypothetical protein